MIKHYRILHVDFSCCFISKPTDSAYTVKCNQYSPKPVPTQRIRFALLMVLLPYVPASMAGAHEENQSLTDTRTQQAITLMNSYAQRSGLTSGQSRKRYLWTDAFAVCNYLGLARATDDPVYTELALKLVDQVHHTLGRHRQDDPRTGWISGLNDDEGEMHPTRGGLRIGKTLPERGPQEEFDARLEWDRDGQYFHYLSKWMHALDQVTRATGQARFNIWARDLAVSAFDAFSYPSSFDSEPRRMVWKKSIDLTRALVPSMGKHDPLDGYITSVQLTTTAAVFPRPDTGPKLEHEIAEFAHMIHDGEWTTDDPLGLGGLLVDAYRVQQLLQQGAQQQPQLLEKLLEAAITGLRYYARSGELQQPPQYRLAFRELGLAIGLHAVERMQQSLDDGGVVLHITNSPRLRAQLGTLMQYVELRGHIENYWRDPEHQHTDSWTEHRDINEVMLATSLAPDGMLELLSPVREQE
jgi:hypothetical protein